MNQSKEERLLVQLGISKSSICGWCGAFERRHDLDSESGFWLVIEAMRNRGFRVEMGTLVGKTGQPEDYWAGFEDATVVFTSRHGATLPEAVFQAACTALGIFDTSKEEPCQKSEQNEQS